MRIQRHALCATAAVFMLGAGAGVALAQQYPSKPLRIVTGGVGGVNDLVSRLIADGIREAWGQTAVVDNRPSGVMPAEITARAAPDGYTILVIGSSFWTQPLLRAVPYDPLRDYVPVTLAVSSAIELAVNPSVPAKTVKELIALSRAKPGSLNYASTGAGGPQHLAAELFNSMAGINIVHVPYKSTGASITALIQGEVQVMFGSTVQMAPQVAAGKARALAVASAQPTPSAPGLPTIAASGVTGYEYSLPQAVFAPARTPRPIVDRLNKDIVAILNRPDSKDRLFKGGVDVIGSSPEQLSAMLKNEVSKWSKLIKERGIKVE